MQAPIILCLSGVIIVHCLRNVRHFLVDHSTLKKGRISWGRSSSVERPLSTKGLREAACSIHAVSTFYSGHGNLASLHGAEETIAADTQSRYALYFTNLLPNLHLLCFSPSTKPGLAGE